jgi:hypothetical protein
MNTPYPMDQPAVYKIQVLGRLDDLWNYYFEDLHIQVLPADDEGIVTTMLTGRIIDQTALQGTLQKLYSLSLPLISIGKIMECCNVLIL